MAAWRVLVFIVLLAAVAAEETSKTVTITCPEGYEMVGTACYFISADTHTGSSAHHYCKKNGGHAAVIESQEEMDLLKETVLNTTVYLGVDMQEYRRYQFQFALKMAGHTGFTAFGAGEPDNYGSEDCVVADISDGFNWKDIHCTELHPVLCKAAAVVSEEERSCGEDEHLFGGATCFWVTSDGPTYTWTEAEDLCRTRGMLLASVHSQEEQDFIYGLADRDWSTWIGLSDRAAEGVWEWSDDTPYNFDNWHAGQPNGGDTQNCVYMGAGSYAGEWYDASCDGHLRAACRGPAS